MQPDKNTNQATDPAKKSLAAVLPEGLLVDRIWLKNKKFNRPLVDYYLRSWLLEAVARGVYRRPGPALKWQHVVYSLTTSGHDLHVGGAYCIRYAGL